MKPLTFGTILFIAAVAADDLYRFLNQHVTVAVPAPPLPLNEWDKEVLLCDKVVDALLHSKDAIEIMRAQAIIQDESCNIGKRL
jgi:hypothetical protein